MPRPIPRLILASTSARRRDLLMRIGIVPDRIIAPAINETPHTGEKPTDYALRLAVEKAQAVPREAGEAILAGDTTVAVGRRILPPADTPEIQRELLTRLSGRRHHVLSAICVIAVDGRVRTRVADTTVTFAPLTAADIQAYIASGEGLGKAGGYAIQGRAEAFVRFLSGSHSGVIGLPLFETRALLRAAGFTLG